MLVNRLPHAELATAEGERRLCEQQARVAALDRKGQRGEESRKLLRNMTSIHQSQLHYLERLRRDLARNDFVRPIDL
jgi:hypothetical protein